jgi:hypothetical protein
MQIIKVKIGEHEIEYALAFTNAPRAYDHGEVIELHGEETDGKWARFILIPTRTVEWQKGRNGSGLYCLHTEKDENSELDENMRRWFEQKLWSRLTGKKG